MAEKKTTPLTIDGVEYQFEDLTSEQQVLVQHVHNLDGKINSSRFALDQLQVGRDAFFGMLRQSLTKQSDSTIAE